MTIKDRIKHAWNAFKKEDDWTTDRGMASSRAPHKSVTPFSTTSFVASIYNRIAMDVSVTRFKHVQVDPETEDEETIDSKLNECLSVEANIDQTHIQFIHDLVFSMFDEGVVAVVPVETTLNPEQTGSYDINTLRTGKITQWFPRHVEVDLYNEDAGMNQRVVLEKKYVAIIENPLYAVVNEENSTLKRLLRKLHQLDDVDALASSNRLDVMISVPYAVKTETQKQMAERRIADIEGQLASGRNGIAYIDGTEKIHQLNRPANSQLPETIEKLTQEFYNQLGLTETIFNGTADEAEIRVYNSRTIDPIVEHIVAEFTRKFFTKTARTRGHKVSYYRDMFKMVPVEMIGNLGDTLRRNYIASSNEIRKIIGLRPSNDPRADELFNPNIADNKQDVGLGGGPELPQEDELEVRKQEEERIDREETHLTRRQREEMKKALREEFKERK